MLRNRVNGKLYVGQARDIGRRYREHNRGHHGEKMKRAIAKYGFDAFDIYVLEEIEKTPDKAALKQTLNDREQHYLDLYQPYDDDKGYNILKIAGSNVGWSPNAEQKAKLLANTPHPKGPDSPWWGRNHAPEARKKVSNARRGKMTRRRRVKQIHPETGEVIRIWETATEAAKAMNVSRNGISAAARQRPRVDKRTGRVYVHTHTAGYRWEYDGEIIYEAISCEDIQKLTEQGESCA
jgi:group I intron endonuclease